MGILANHLFRCSPVTVEYSGRIDGHGLIPTLVGDLPDRFRIRCFEGDACIIDHNIDASPFLHRSRDKAVHALRVADIDFDEDGIATEGFDKLDSRCVFLRIAGLFNKISDDDFGPFGGIGCADCASYATTATSHYCDLICQAAMDGGPVGGHWGSLGRGTAGCEGSEINAAGSQWRFLDGICGGCEKHEKHGASFRSSLFVEVDPANSQLGRKGVDLLNACGGKGQVGLGKKSSLVV